MTTEKQPPPNNAWCVGCDPDNCAGCGTPEMTQGRFKQALEQLRIATEALIQIEGWLCDAMELQDKAKDALCAMEEVK